jgi:hypothetical protein
MEKPGNGLSAEGVGECGKREALTGDWRRLHNEELHELYCSLNITRVIRSRRMGRAGHVAYRGERRYAHSFFGRENLRETGHLEDLGIDG